MVSPLRSGIYYEIIIIILLKLSVPTCIVNESALTVPGSFATSYNYGVSWIDVQM